MRISVSAEVYGDHNKKENFKAPIHAKPEESILHIIQLLNQSVLFSHLEDKEKRILALAMELREFGKGDMVIKEGDDGNDLFIIDEGELKCTKRDKKTGEDKFLLNYHKGMAFGELALLYNAPRAASIQALENVKLYSLDRETFNIIVKEAVMKKRQKFHDFLGKVELLDTLDTMEKDKLCDCLKVEKYQKDDFIIRQGEAGDIFYFVVEGTAIAEKE